MNSELPDLPRGGGSLLITPSMTDGDTETTEDGFSCPEAPEEGGNPPPRVRDGVVVQGADEDDVTI